MLPLMVMSLRAKMALASLVSNGLCRKMSAGEVVPEAATGRVRVTFCAKRVATMGLSISPGKGLAAVSRPRGTAVNIFEPAFEPLSSWAEPSIPKINFSGAISGSACVLGAMLSECVSA